MEEEVAREEVEMTSLVSPDNIIRGKISPNNMVLGHEYTATQHNPVEVRIHLRQLI